MRYDQAIYFIKESALTYDADTGDYSGGEMNETLKRASVMDLGREDQSFYFGGLKEGSKFVQLQSHYTDPFDYIRIDGRYYKVETETKLKQKHVFVVSEVKK